MPTRAVETAHRSLASQWTVGHGNKGSKKSVKIRKARLPPNALTTRQHSQVVISGQEIMAMTR